MGSFNDTCCISKLPITYGDKVKVIFIKQKNNSNGFECNIDERFLFCSLPFDAVYEDYGLYSSNDTEILSMLNSNIKQYTKDEIEEMFTKKRKEIKNNHNDWESVFKAIHEGWLFDSDDTFISKFVVKKEIYDWLVFKNKQRNFNDELLSINFYTKKIKEAIDSFNRLGNLKSIKTFIPKGKAFSFLEFYCYKEMGNIILKNKENLKKLAELCVLSNKMECLNIMIDRTIYSGQSTCFDVHQKFHKEILNIIDNKLKEEY